MNRAQQIVPRPARVEETGEPIVISPSTPIVAESPESAPVAAALAAQLRADGGPGLSIATAPPAGPVILLTLRGADAGLGAEGYELEAGPGGVIVRAAAPAGLFYGVQTLRQLAGEDDGEWSVPGVRVRDVPRFAWRGLMLDSSRHIHDLGWIKRTLDLMAYHKLNVFHWHLTDDQGWRIESRKYPKLTEVGAWRNGEYGKPYASGERYGGFYRQDELREIVAYAAERHITVVPEVDMPGHMVAALASYPELACTPGPFEVRQSWGIADDVLCAGKESVFQFAQDVLTEVMDIFPSEVIHIGGDECPRRRWEECPTCQARIRSEGLQDEDALQNYFTRRISDFLNAHGRRLMGWNEILAGGDLAQDTIVHMWNWPHAAGEAIAAGNDAVNSLWPWLYFDYDHYATPLRKVYEYDPEPEGIAPENRAHFLGPQAALWTEHRPDDAACDEYLWPRTVALAEIAWSPQAQRDLAEFTSRMHEAHFDRLARMGLGVAGVPAAEVKRGLEERSHVNLGLQVGAWTAADLAGGPATLEFDISDAYVCRGTYTVTFQHDGGWQGLSFTGARVVRDGSELSADTHAGYAGVSSRHNLYTFRLHEPIPGTRTLLRVECAADEGTDASGLVWIAGPET